MAQNTFTPTGTETHLDARVVWNGNATDAESRLGSLESAPPAHTHTVSDITDIATTYAPISHTHTVSDIDSGLAANGTVATADGAGNVTWEVGGGGGAAAFSVLTVTTATYTQTTEHTNYLYDDTLLTPGGGGSGGSGSGGGACMVVDLLPVAQHVGVTIHKKIGDSCDIELVAPVGSTIDGAASYLLTSQYESISIFTDGSNYFIQ